jgi:hypothetical protein
MFCNFNVFAMLTSGENRIKQSDVFAFARGFFRVKKIFNEFHA